MSTPRPPNPADTFSKAAPDGGGAPLPARAPSPVEITVPEAPLPTPRELGQVGVGDRLGPYEMLRKLGQGGMASVFLGRHVESGTQVAVKVMLPHLAADATYVRRFETEAASCQGVEHPNLVSVLTCGEDRGRYFMAFEYVDGFNLEEHLRDTGPLPWPLVVELGIHLVRGLAHAHNQGIIHRDIKPSNLLLSTRGILKLADFGVAKHAGAQTLTQTGGMVGTPMYVSPEMAGGERVDLRSDLYMVGLCLREMITGNNPFYADNVAASVKLILSGVPSLYTEAPSVPSSLERVVERLMRRDPAERFAKSEEVLTALLNVRQQAQLPTDLLVRLANHNVQTVGEIRRELADKLLVDAQRLLKKTHADRPAGALKLYAALQLLPSHAEAAALFEPLCKQEHYRFGASTDGRAAELEKGLKITGENASALQQLAQLYRNEGSIHLCAATWRRYLVVRPEDGFAQNQLFTLTREKMEPATPAASTRTPAATTSLAAVKRGLTAPITAQSLHDAPSNWAAWVLAICVVGGTIHLVGKRLRAAGEQAVGNSLQERQNKRSQRTPNAMPRVTGRHAVDNLRSECQQASAPACVAAAEALEPDVTGADLAQVLLIKGAAHRKAGNQQDAVDALTLYLDTHGGAPGAQEALLRRGQARRALHDDSGALADFSAALNGGGAGALNTEALVERAELLITREQPAEALVDLRLAWTSTQPGDPLRVRMVAGFKALVEPPPTDGPAAAP